MSASRVLRGTRGVAAVCAALLAGAAVLQFVAAPAWHDEAQRAGAQADRRQAERRADAARRHDAGTAATPKWPTAAQAAERVADVLERAVREGVTVKNSQQRIDAASAGLQPIRLAQAAVGEYRGLRRFIGGALEAEAALGLDRVRLQRENEQAREWSADLQWLLVQRVAASAP